MMKPLLSVVIASYNSAKHIECCLRSIRAEYDPRLEVILIDGGSDDGTLDVVDRFRDVLSIVVSEPDGGQSDAFNKGFKRASGRFMTWLNSDDVLCPGAIVKALAYMEDTDAHWLAANCLYIDNDSSVLRCCRSGGFERFALKFGLLNVFGPSAFFSRELFEEMGDFREDFHFCMDTEYWWRIAARGIAYERIPCYFWALRLHEDAKTASAITGDFNKRPERMQVEGALLRDMYYPHRSPVGLKVGVLLVRIYRLLNGSYISALWDTFKVRGKSYTDLTV